MSSAGGKSPGGIAHMDRLPPLGLLLSAESLCGRRTGVGNYTLHLWRSLSSLPGIGSIQLFAGLRRLSAIDPGGTPPVFQKADRPCLPGGSERVPSWRVLARRLRLGESGYEALFRARFGLAAGMAGVPRDRVCYHEPNMIPRPFGGVTVSTFQDLAWHRHPEVHPVERLRWIERHMPRALAQTRRIITTSNFTRREVVSVLGVEESRIDVVPLGVDGRFRPHDPDELLPVLAHHGLQPGGYLLSVGTVEPRKNLGRLLRAYAALPPAVAGRCPLVIVGASGWLNSPELARMDSLERAGRVRYLGYVDEADLPALYAGARAFAYPSLYEGFGLPPLEAMASGTPVLSSAGTSMAEVVGDAGLLVDPLDEEAIAGGLRLLLEDDGAAARRRGAGLARAAGFTWDRCARSTLAVYRTALGLSDGAA